MTEPGVDCRGQVTQTDDPFDSQHRNTLTPGISDPITHLTRIQRTRFIVRTRVHPPDDQPNSHATRQTRRMPASQLQGLLSDLTEDFQARETTDVLQFCADWFQARLKAEVS